MNKYNTLICNNKMSFDECELAILRQAVDESELTKSMRSLFKVNKQFSIGNKLNSKVFSINLIIRTADLNDYSDYNSYAISSPEDRDRYNFINKNIQPFINRLKSIGYDISKNDLDLKIDSWKYITAGIKIIITK